MKELSLREIIEHSQRVEQESYAFYSSAVAIVQSPDVKPLLAELAAEELKHFNSLRALLHQERLDRAALEARIGVETDLFNRFVKTHEITEFSSQREILEIALERENNTGAMYSMLLTISNLAEDAVVLFEDLQKQELGHAARIKTLIQRLDKR